MTCCEFNASGLAVGFYSHEAVFSHAGEHMTTFEPAVPSEQADKRFMSWQKAVLKSFDLDELA